MNEEKFLQVQAIEFERLLEKSTGDPILEPQLRRRLDEVRQALQATRQRPGTFLPTETPVPPRAAIFLRGGSVHDSDGIRPSLAGEALIQYEKMFTEQALHDERVAARAAGRQRRPRGAAIPELLFTGTPRGSFGLEFVPLLTDDDALIDVHARSLENIANALIRVAESDTTKLSETVSSIPPRVLPPLKRFMKTLAQHGAELRFAFENQPGRSLSACQIDTAASLLERGFEERDITVDGIFRGVTWDSGVFDLRTHDGAVITGTVADQLTEEDLERIDDLINRPCVAELQETIVQRITGEGPSSYVLLDARPAGVPTEATQ